MINRGRIQKLDPGTRYPCIMAHGPGGLWAERCMYGSIARMPRSGPHPGKDLNQRFFLALSTTKQLPLWAECSGCSYGLEYREK